MHGHERYGHVNIQQHTACLAVHVIMPLYPAVIATRLISKGQFLNQPMLCQEVQRAVDRPVPNVWVSTTDTLEYLPGGEM